MRADFRHGAGLGRLAGRDETGAAAPGPCGASSSGSPGSAGSLAKGSGREGIAMEGTRLFEQALGLEHPGTWRRTSSTRRFAGSTCT